MIVLIIQALALGWLSFAAARHLTRHWIDSILGASIFVWANITVTCLFLSALGKLGEPAWLFRTSLLLGLGTLFIVMRIQPAEANKDTGAHDKISIPLAVFFAVTIVPIFIGNVLIAGAYLPNNWDSLTYHLPRAMFYLGQGSLNHFETNNFRQTFFPFNFNLLHLTCYEYFAPLQTVNFLNLGAWVISGLGVFRIARLCACSLDGALIGAWMSLVSTQILAQATTTTNDLPLGAGLLCAVVFTLRWTNTSHARDAILAGVAIGLIIGTKLTVVFFVPAAGLIFAILFYQRAKAAGGSMLQSNLRPWTFAAIPMVVLGSSFAVINIMNTGLWMTKQHDYALNRPFSLAVVVQTTKAYFLQLFIEPFGRFTFDTQFFATFNEWAARTFFSNWNEAYAFSPLYLLPPDLNEDHVWFGFIGPFALVCGVICLLGFSRTAPRIAACSLLGVGWFASHFLLYKWSLYNQRYFVPVILVLLPCVAYVWDRWAGRNGLIRTLTRLLFGLVAATSVWFAVHYMMNNTRRPLGPVLAGTQLASDAPDIPAALADRLTGHSKINIISDGANERVFLLMSQGARYTSHRKLDNSAYNIISKWAFVRNNIYSNIAYSYTYALIPLLDKPTAGIESFGTIGNGVIAFDYFGLNPNPDESTPGPGANNIMLLLQFDAAIGPNRFAKTLIRIAGLNPRDNAQAFVGAELADGSDLPLATFTSSGESEVSLTAPFKRIYVNVKSTRDDNLMGSGELSYSLRTNDSTSVAPADVAPLFIADLISGNTRPLTSISGLATREGPYGQWGLPVFRWSKEPAVRIDVPSQPDMKRIRLTFSARLQVREEAHLAVLVNGVQVHEVHLQRHEAWFDETVVVTAGPGANIIELKDNSHSTEPDWNAYLDQNPDVKDWLVSVGQPLEAGAKEHYELKGESEHRPLPVKNRAAALPPEGLYFMYRALRVEGLPAER